MKRLRFLGLSLLLLVIACFFNTPAFAEHPWIDEAPMIGKDEDMGGGKKGDQDTYYRWTKQDVFTASGFINDFTAKVTLLLVDWQIEHAVTRAVPVDNHDLSISRNTQVTQKLK